MKKIPIIAFVFSIVLYWTVLRATPRELTLNYAGDPFLADDSAKNSRNRGCYPHGRENEQSAEICAYWQSAIDPTVKNPGLHIDQNQPDNVLTAIQCLLAMQGNKNEARIHGATNADVSDIFIDPCTVEVAALFYATYLFYDRWDYAMAIVLVEKNTGKYNTPYAINRAYELYKIWYEKILKIGLKRARELQLDPLDNSDVRWY